MSKCAIPEFYSHSEPVARKQHLCCECRAPILPGERHFAWRGKWDGSMNSGRQHLLCMEACMLIRDKLNDHECIGFGELFEFFDEMQTSSAEGRKHEAIGQLRNMMARIKWRERTGKIAAIDDAAKLLDSV